MRRKKVAPDIQKFKLRDSSRGGINFFMRSHRCESCEKIYAHRCKGNHRYLCDDCQERKESQ